MMIADRRERPLIGKGGSARPAFAKATARQSSLVRRLVEGRIAQGEGRKALGVGRVGARGDLVEKPDRKAGWSVVSGALCSE